MTSQVNWGKIKFILRCFDPVPKSLVKSSSKKSFYYISKRFSPCYDVVVGFEKSCVKIFFKKNFGCSVLWKFLQKNIYWMVLAIEKPKKFFMRKKKLRFFLEKQKGRMQILFIKKSKSESDLLRNWKKKIEYKRCEVKQRIALLMVDQTFLRAPYHIVTFHEKIVTVSPSLISYCKFG